MNGPRLGAGDVSLLVAALNLLVPPVARSLARVVADGASSSEGAFYAYFACLACGSLVSLGLGIIWLFAIIIADAPRWRYAGLVGTGFLLHGIAIYGGCRALGLRRS